MMDRRGYTMRTCVVKIVDVYGSDLADGWQILIVT
jgi:hypothetical protein